MRMEVAKLVEDGNTEDQIRAMFVARYGERILTEPEGVRRLFLYSVPVLLTLLALLGIMMYLKRRGSILEGAPLPMAFVGELED
jgi:cytochrome c-type biogenesis protein CcmH/NrfF